MKRLAKIRSVLTPVAGILFFLLLSIYAFNEGEKVIRAKTEIVFEEAINKDLNNRTTKAPFTCRGPSGRTIKSIRVISEENNGRIEFEYDPHEHTSDGQYVQFYILEKHSLQPEGLNILFKQSLDNMGIYTEATGIIYRDQGVEQYSSNDSVSMQSALLTREHNILFEEMGRVQAWVKYVPTNIISHIPGWMGCSIVVYFLLMTSTGVYKIVKKERNKQRTLQAENERRKAREAKRVEYEMNLFGNTCQFEGMTLYERTRTIYADGITCTLGRNEFRLLWMLATAPDQTLLAKDIQEVLWPDSITAQNNMDVLINTLRKSLLKLPNYRLDNLKGMKFKLVCSKRDSKQMGIKKGSTL